MGHAPLRLTLAALMPLSLPVHPLMAAAEPLQGRGTPSGAEIITVRPAAASATRQGLGPTSCSSPPTCPICPSI